MWKHLFKLIWNQRKKNIWLMMELLFVFVCLWYVIDFTLSAWSIYRQPLGFNIKHTYRVDLVVRTEESKDYVFPEKKTSTLGEDLLTLVERLRLNPDVEAVSLSIGSQPYAATGFSSQVYYDRLFYKDTIGITAQRYEVTPSFFNVFRILPEEEGHVKNLSEVLNAQSIILSADAKAKLIQDESTSRIIRIGDDRYPKQIAAICRSQRWTEYRRPSPSYYTLLSEQRVATDLTVDNLPNVEICVRVKEEKDTPDFPQRFITHMASQLNIGNLFLMDIRPSSIIRKGVVLPEESNLNAKLILCGFLLVNIFLGVAGTFWLQTQRRKGEMGLRVSLGSTKKALKILLIEEGLFILTLAVVPGILINANIAKAELINLWIDNSVIRFVTGIVITYFIMGIMIVCGVWYPAHRVSKIEPAQALHYE